ncbi:hypothetical protein Peur_002844 [Populus x canadensis]
MISLPSRTHYSATSKFIELVHYNLYSPISSPPEYLPDDGSLHLASLKKQWQSSSSSMLQEQWSFFEHHAAAMSL